MRLAKCPRAQDPPSLFLVCSSAELRPSGIAAVDPPADYLAEFLEAVTNVLVRVGPHDLTSQSQIKKRHAVPDRTAGDRGMTLELTGLCGNTTELCANNNLTRSDAL